MTSGPAVTPPRDVGVLNVANALTTLRLLLVPAFVLLLFAGDAHAAGWRLGAAAVFIGAAVTDRIDGEVARRCDLVTDFGKIADPVADKVLIGTALVSLSVLGELAWWVTGLVLLREVGVTLLRFIVIRHGVIAASKGGKVKTVLQTVAIAIYVLPVGGLLSALGTWVMAAAVVVTVVTGLDYVVRALHLRRDSKRAAVEGRDREPVRS